LEELVMSLDYVYQVYAPDRRTILASFTRKKESEYWAVDWCKRNNWFIHNLTRTRMRCGTFWDDDKLMEMADCPWEGVFDGKKE